MIIKYPISYTWIDYPDDDSLAIIIYTMGCTNNCDGCHNPEFRDPLYKDGAPFVSYIEGIDSIHLKIRKMCYLLSTNKVVLSGGDPLSTYNIEETKSILSRNTDLDFCIYTSMGIENVISNNVKGFKFIKCGGFNKELIQPSEKTNDYIQFASSNQELYDNDFNLLSTSGRYYFNKGGT